MDRTTRLVVIALALLLGCAPAAHAQACAGLPAFAAGNLHLQGAVEFGNDATSFAGGAAFGSPTLYGGFLVGVTSYDDLDGSSFVIGGNAGYQMPVGVTRRSQLCPVATLTFGFGPNDVGGSDIDVSTRSFTFGARLGHVLPGQPGLQIIPTGALHLAWQEVRLSDDDGRDRENDDTYGILELGAGFLFNATFSVRPSVNIPIGLDGADPSFAVVVAYALRRGRAR